MHTPDSFLQNSAFAGSCAIQSPIDGGGTNRQFRGLGDYPGKLVCTAVYMRLSSVKRNIDSKIGRGTPKVTTDNSLLVTRELMGHLCTPMADSRLQGRS